MPDTEALHCVEVDKTHSRLRLRRIPLSMIDLLVLVSPLGKTSVDAVFICVDEYECARALNQSAIVARFTLDNS